MATTSSEETQRFARTQKAYRENDPPVEVNQVWSAPNEEGVKLRRVRVLAIHPDSDNDGKRLWITQDVPGGKFKMDNRLLVCPEFNLRYVFELEHD